MLWFALLCFTQPGFDGWLAGVFGWAVPLISTASKEKSLGLWRSLAAGRPVGYKPPHDDDEVGEGKNRPGKMDTGRM